MNILLIEDDIEISDMLKNFLITEDFEIITAYDGESACQKFFSDEYSLVLLDLMIPKKNGMEVMNIIRKNSTVPIIIISAKDTDSDKTLGFSMGGLYYKTLFYYRSVSKNKSQYPKKYNLYNICKQRRNHTYKR